MGYLLDFFTLNPLIELGGVALILVLFGYIASFLKQPILAGYLIGGLLLGPQVFDLIQHYEHIEFYAHFGVSLLLFMVGLGLNPGIIKEVGKVSVIAGVGQVLFTSIIGYLIALALGFSQLVSLFIAIALTFSSTIIIVKLVSDRGDSGTMYGKIALGILIVQDIIAMILLLTISAFTLDAGQSGTGQFVATIALTVLGLVAFAWLAAKYVLPHIMKALSEQKELLLLFIISWAILFGGLWYYAGFSMEIGALLAGVTLANSRFRYHIMNELRPFRDFFLALFFVYLGGQIIFDSIGQILIPTIIFSLFVLIGNPLIVITLMMKLGYNRKTSFMTGLTVAQISEFSFIIIGLALTAGMLQDPNVLSLVTIVGLITMTGSSYLFAHADSIFKYLSPYLTCLECRTKETTHLLPENEYQIIIIGFGRLGKFIASKLHQHQLPFCIIDNDIKKVEQAENLGFNVIFTDIEDNDALSDVVSTQTEVVYSTVTDHDTSIHLLTSVKASYPEVRVIALANYFEEAENLYSHHADYVIFPHLSGAHESWDILEKHVYTPEDFGTHKLKNREALEEHRSHI